MHLLYKRIYDLNLSLDLQLILFDNTILPTITYGSDVWGYENLKIFECIHNQFLRSITKCRESTSLYMLYGELGRYPISITIKTRIISILVRIITGNSEKFVNVIYQKLLQIVMGGGGRGSGGQQFKWTRNVQSILQEVSGNDVWINQKENIPNTIKHTLKKILIDQFVQKWHNTLN